MFSDRLKKLNPYKPGEQLKDRVYIKLNANENAYPPSAHVAEEVNKFLSEKSGRLGLYPDPDSTELREAIAEHLNRTGGVLSVPEKAAARLTQKITKDMIFCGNGSDEVLSFVFYAFFNADKSVITPEFSYSFYPVYAGYYGISLKKVPLLSDFSLDTDTMLKNAGSSTGIIFANPNAPTGIGLSCSDIKKMLDAWPADLPFVVDEAYADFGTESVIPLLAEYKNLVVVRTFSKSLSFAGMRMGYLVANPEVIQAVTTVKNSFNHFPADIICQTAAKAACLDVDYYASTTQKTVATRDRFRETLLKAGYTVLPSETNFVFARHPSLGGHEVYEKVKEAGILIRHFDTEGIRDFVRITIGTDEQMDKLASVMVSLA